MWFETLKIRENIVAICENGHWQKTRSYLFKGSEISVLVDTATGICPIREVVESITGSRVDVITTHAHWDHIGGHQDFERVHVHEKDADWLINGIPLPPEFIRKQVMKEPFTLPAGRHFDPGTYFPPRIETPIILKDKDLLDYGEFCFEIIHTPGHSPGSICVQERNSGLVASGDLVLRSIVHANYESTSPEQVLLSYRKLAERLGKISGILPGHYDCLLNPGLVKEGLELLEELEENGLVRHGAGLNRSQNTGFLF